MWSPRAKRVAEAFRHRRRIVCTNRPSSSLASRAPLGSSNALISSTTGWENRGEDASENTPPILVAVKDNIVTSDLLTTCASALLQNYQSPYEAFVATKLCEKGWNIMGKANMDEFGMGSHSTNSFFGAVRNGEYSAGGSSGGSAMSLVDGQCSFAIGTDTGGSVRLPAAYSGVVGFKPSYGLLSRTGVIPYANSLDTVGVLAHSVEAAHTAFRAMNSTVDDNDPSTLSQESRNRAGQVRKTASDDLKKRAQHGVKNETRPILQGVRIGVPTEYNIIELQHEVRVAWRRSLSMLQDVGCTLVPVSLPNTKHALSAYYILAPAEASSNLAKYDGVRYGSREQPSDGVGDVLYSKTRDGFGDEVKRRILLGSYTLSSKAIDNYFIKAQKVRRLVQRDFNHVFSMANPLQNPKHFDLADMDESVQLDSKLGPAQVDFIICPTAPTLPPKLDQVLDQTPVDNYMNDVFTVPASLAGLPAISIPFKISSSSERYEPRVSAGSTSSIGIQIIGQYYDDEGVLGISRLFEALLKEQKGAGTPKGCWHWHPKGSCDLGPSFTDLHRNIKGHPVGEDPELQKTHLRYVATEMRKPPIKYFVTKNGPRKSYLKYVVPKPRAKFFVSEKGSLAGKRDEPEPNKKLELDGDDLFSLLSGWDYNVRKDAVGSLYSSQGGKPKTGGLPWGRLPPA
ncbi:amidase signature domain-containing protein [Amylocarpus encephaloides]|uniref:Glutamyl-tRNA(Gln) amidotransferase subunit A, mitochondrial n=1 Tax=Amylocarpus encephaloides TaxID=45428 RepID=A0A9P7YDU5_9HELO|nr:amidase signature domain-containing protein [Amylocarpus encephaloides]